MKRLYEEEDEEDENPEEEKIIQQSLHGDEKAAQSVPMTDANYRPVADGEIPQNSDGVVSGQFDSANPNTPERITFQQGNYNQAVGYPKLIADKVSMLTQTLVPLIEISLLELLGSTQLYQRQTGQVALSFNNNQAQLSFSFVYVVSNFVGTDIDESSIAHDSMYIMNRIRPVGANITKCEIDTAEGSVIIQGSM